MMRLIIGNKNYSTWSMRPWLLLTAFNLPFEETMESLVPEETLTERLLCHSPSARVPVLIDGDLCIWDSLAICEYLSENYLDGGGYPADTKARATARALTAEMHAEFTALREALPMNIRARRKVQLGEKALADIRRIDAIWSDYPPAHGDAFLFGDFSIADCFYAPVAMRFLTYPTDIKLSPAAAAYHRRLCAHPAVQAWQQGALAETDIVPQDETGEDIS